MLVSFESKMYVIFAEVDLFSKIEVLILDLNQVQDASLLISQFHLAYLLGFWAESVPIVIELYGFSS